MANFTKAEEREFSDARSMAGQVDADGFTLVGSASKRKGGPLRPDPAATLSGGGVNPEDQSSNKSKKSKEKKDFYRFQIREQKKQEMNGLLKRFREDQEKIKELKEKKRFRPY